MGSKKKKKKKRREEGKEGRNSSSTTNHYPERLGKVFLIHVPSLFMRARKIVYPYIDKNTRNKFIFVEDKNLRGSLLEDIDEDQLLEIYGGKLKLMPH
ncbi:hypothetical protein M5K25_000247 [Dendrobium thyrsiflorum]|uniref:CRAL-TRIO domain-containing protein n=1 Tax=Dendrobium thyrsiflorum TaxID=117978 RepID=A0ABD0W5P5_DENTH